MFFIKGIIDGVSKKNIITPMSLNNRLARATLFALLMAPIPAKRTIELLPKWDPKMIGMAKFKEIKPCIAREIVRPIVAVLL